MNLVYYNILECAAHGKVPKVRKGKVDLLLENDDIKIPFAVSFGLTLRFSNISQLISS